MLSKKPGLPAPKRAYQLPSPHAHEHMDPWQQIFFESFMIQKYEPSYSLMWALSPPAKEVVVKFLASNVVKLARAVEPIHYDLKLK